MYQRRVAVLQRRGVSAPHRHARISLVINIVRSPNHAGVYFVTQSSGDVSKESLKNNIGLKFAFRSTDINEIKQTLEFFGIDKDDENNQKRLRDFE